MLLLIQYWDHFPTVSTTKKNFLCPTADLLKNWLFWACLIFQPFSSRCRIRLFDIFCYFYCIIFSAKIIYLFQVQRGNYKIRLLSTRVYISTTNMFSFFFRVICHFGFGQTLQSTFGGHKNAKIIDTKINSHLTWFSFYHKCWGITVFQKNWRTNSFPIIASD